ncbi:winged helix-turn-helix transcriptional regulator [Amycolatopsis speibonae]|uniref:Winged helix-turn-helix transcriptional regulator n=1 Tax=Amycolatopsis speibonae TaxID=1450224 RepID=A0ABV7P0I9_9PSEU
MSIVDAHTASGGDGVTTDSTVVPMQRQLIVDPPHDEVVLVRIDELQSADSPRVLGENIEHVRALAEIDEFKLPPVLVQRNTLRVIDGMHRIHAAELRGCRTIAVQFYDGSESDSFVAAVTRNTTHGLPLSLADRTAATARIMASHPHWSDRKIAEVTGLSPTTVKAVRECSTDQAAHSNTRVGRDGRTRPINAGVGRILASELIRENPDASLRQIAEAAGVSPSTVLDVRERLRADRDPLPPKVRRGPVSRAATTRDRQPARSHAEATDVDWEVSLRQLRDDPSIRFTDSGRTLLRLLDTRLLRPAERQRLATSIPPYCAVTVVVLAKLVRDAWHDLAMKLEQHYLPVDRPGDADSDGR